MQSYFSLRLLVLWNAISSAARHSYHRFQRWANYQRAYWEVKTSQWLFLPGHTLPISGVSLRDACPPDWIYDEATRTLTQSVASDTPYQLSWLSTKLVVLDPQHPDREYDMDDWLSELRVYATDPPPLPILFQSWCAHHKQWFAQDRIVQFHIIDHHGEERMLSLKVDSDCLFFDRHKISAKI